jgi:hypothetical protein
MTIIGLIVGVLVALLVLKFIKGTIKFVVLAAIILFALFMAHQGGAF